MPSWRATSHTVAAPCNSPARGRPGGRRAATRDRVALAALCTLLFLTFLDNTVVSVGLGDVQTDLHASVADLQWVVGGYALGVRLGHARLQA